MRPNFLFVKVTWRLRSSLIRAIEIFFRPILEVEIRQTDAKCRRRRRRNRRRHRGYLACRLLSVRTALSLSLALSFFPSSVYVTGEVTE